MLAGHSKPLDRECFISTGATADFPKLVKAALAADFLEALQELGYTRLTLQVGNLLPYFHDIKPKVSEARGLDITAFDFNKAGLGAEMMKVKEARGRRKQGVVISHAGAGTILDAMRLGLPLIVVPNVQLLDNHQEELAQELQRQGYVKASDVEGLAAALREVETKGRRTWGSDSGATSAATVVDEMVGFEQVVRSSLD